MKVYDLTHPMGAGMTLYPGTPAPNLRKAAVLERDRYRETELTLFSHMGTHMDAPAHLLVAGETLDNIPAERFLGTAFVPDVRGERKITRAALCRWEKEIRRAEFLLICTGWAQYWGSEQYPVGFPVLTEDAASWLAALPGLKGIGVDTLSPDAVGAPLAAHGQLLAAGKLIVENLRGLESLCGKHLRFAALPLLYADADGAPVRAVAWEDER